MAQDDRENLGTLRTQPPKPNAMRMYIITVCIALLIFAVSAFFAYDRNVQQDDFLVVWPANLTILSDNNIAVSVWDETKVRGEHAPRQGATVQLYQIPPKLKHSDRQSIAEHIASGHVRLLAESTTDARGHTALSLAPLRFLHHGTAEMPKGSPVAWIPKREAKTEKNKPKHTYITTHTVDLVVRIDTGDDEIFTHRSFSLPKQTTAALSLDRPLYQPGQRVHARALVVDTELGKPVVSPATWEVRDPRGNLVLRDTTETSEHGISRLDFSLDTQCIQGLWTLRVQTPHDTQTQTIQVQPFRLPRFRVRIQPTTSKAEAGQPISATIQARTTYDTPVAEGDLLVAIQYTRRGGMQGSKSVEGKLDANGLYTLSWDLPEDAQPGSTLTVRARVTSQAGRSEDATQTLHVQGDSLHIDLWSSQGKTWAQDIQNTGYVAITNGRGQPSANTRVTLVLPEQGTERSTTLTTDAQGYASFSWAPRASSTQTIRATLEPQQGRPSRHNIQATVQNRRALIELDSPRVRVDTPFNVRIREAQQHGVLIAQQRNTTLASAHIPKGSTETALSLSANARGLVSLKLFNAFGRLQAEAAVWVEQETTSAVSASTDADTYTPASQATLSLSFPPHATTNPPPNAPKAPVAFNVVGVDEALYALKERTQLPLHILLRQETSWEQLAAALSILDTPPPASAAQNPTHRAIQNARFQSTVRPQDNAHTHNNTYLTGRVRQARLRPWVWGWVCLLLLLTVLCTFHAAHATWNGFSRHDWGWKRALALVGVGILAVGIAAAFLSASPDTLAGGLLVWSGVVIAWLSALAWNERSTLTLASFLRSTGFGVLLVLAIALSLFNTSTPKALEIAMTIAFGLCGLILFIELVLWALALHARRNYKPAFGIATWAAFALLPLATLFISGGRHAEQATKSSASVDRDFEEEPTIEKPAARFAALADGKDTPTQGQGNRDDQDGQNAPQSAPRVRNYFPETMVWLPELLSQPDGTATVPLELPDSITTWRINVSASSHDGRYGEAQLGLRVLQDFFLELDLPTHLTVGDTLAVPVTLVNPSNAPTSATLSVLKDQTQGFLITQPLPNEPITIPPRDRVTVNIPIRATTPGTQHLALQALQTDGPGDAVQRSATVEPDGRKLALTTSGIIADSWNASLNLPPKTLPGSVDTRVNIFPSILTDAKAGLSSMVRKPTGCFEQTSSAHYPNVLVLRALRDTPTTRWPEGPEDWKRTHDQTTEFVQRGLQRILSYQNPDGGFGLYRNRPSDLMLTAYGLMQLTETSTVHPVDPNLIQRVRNALINRQDRKKGNWPTYGGRLPNGQSRPNDDPGMLRAASFITWAIASSPSLHNDYQAKQSLTRATQYLIQNADASDAPDTLALLANALLAAKQPEHAKPILTRLLASAKREGDIAFWSSTQPTWMTGSGRYADIETTALAAFALLKANQGGDLLTPILRYLTKQRTAWGGWGTTQATVQTLKTFELLRSFSKDPTTLRLEADGRPMIPTSNPSDSTGSITLQPGDPRLLAFRTDQPPTAAPRVSIASSSKTSTIAQLRSTFAVPWDAPEANVSGERFEATLKLSTRTPKTLQPIQATVTITNLSTTQHGATIVELPIPPGAIFVRETLEDWKTTGRIDQFEVTPTHARIYLSTFKPRAKDVFIYSFYPAVPGTFSLPPTRAYAFYTPDPITEINSGDITTSTP